MPFYPGPANGTTWTGPYIPQTTVLAPGDLPQTLFATADGSGNAILSKASAAVALQLPPVLAPQLVVSVSGVFSGAPGTFEIDLQEADVDADGMYVSNATTITTVNANNAFHVIITVKAKFVRLFVKTLPNNVSLIATVQA